MANSFVHVELNTTDLPKAKEFYGKLFEWELQDTPMPDGVYTMIKPASGTGGGMMKHPMPGAPSAWLPYVSVDDINVSTEKARSLGANVIVSPQQIPNVGWFSIFIDPTGATLAMYQAK
jgi:predicted enzyme related to lactoylglutathione lyase